MLAVSLVSRHQIPPARTLPLSASVWDTLHLRRPLRIHMYIAADSNTRAGAVTAVWLGEKLGRRKSVLVGTTIMSIGAILQIASFSTAQMIVGRIVAGVGNGINTATAPVWQTVCLYFCPRREIFRGHPPSFLLRSMCTQLA